MRFLIPLSFFLFFSACSGNPEVSIRDEVKRKDLIRSNQSDANQAQSDYKKLQAQRNKE